MWFLWRISRATIWYKVGLHIVRCWDTAEDHHKAESVWPECYFVRRHIVMGSLDLRMDQGRPHPALSINNRGPSKGFVSSPLTLSEHSTYQHSLHSLHYQPCSSAGSRWWSKLLHKTSCDCYRSQGGAAECSGSRQHHTSPARSEELINTIIECLLIGESVFINNIYYYDNQDISSSYEYLIRDMWPELSMLIIISDYSADYRHVNCSWAFYQAKPGQLPLAVRLSSK